MRAEAISLDAVRPLGKSQSKNEIASSLRFPRNDGPTSASVRPRNDDSYRKIRKEFYECFKYERLRQGYCGAVENSVVVSGFGVGLAGGAEDG